MITYLNCFNLIKLSLLQKKRYTYIPINKKNTEIMFLLLKYNVILGYKIIQFNKVKKYLIFINTQVPYYNIKNLLKVTKPRFLKIKDLKNLSNKNTLTNYILCTSVGFINIKEAIFLKIGGILIFRIN